MSCQQAGVDGLHKRNVVTQLCCRLPNLLESGGPLGTVKVLILQYIAEQIGTCFQLELAYLRRADWLALQVFQDQAQC